MNKYTHARQVKRAQIKAYAIKHGYTIQFVTELWKLIDMQKAYKEQLDKVLHIVNTTNIKEVKNDGNQN